VREAAHEKNAPNRVNTQRDEPVERNTTSGFLLRFGIQRTMSKGLTAKLTLLNLVAKGGIEPPTHGFSVSAEQYTTTNDHIQPQLNQRVAI
jgi:hypothetical protein